MLKPLVGVIDIALLLCYFSARPKNPFNFPIPKNQTTLCVMLPALPVLGKAGYLGNNPKKAHANLND